MLTAIRIHLKASVKYVTFNVTESGKVRDETVTVSVVFLEHYDLQCALKVINTIFKIFLLNFQ